MRDRPLNPSTAGILSSIFRRICAFAPLFEGQIVLFGSHRNGPSDRFLLRLDALRTARARTADRGREFDLDDVCLPLVDRWGPTETGLPLRAGCLLLLPVNNKSLDIEALTCLGLPFHIWFTAGRAGPNKSTSSSCRLVTNSSASRYPVSTMWVAGSSRFSWSASCMVGVTAPSATGAAVVSTCVMRCGVSSSQVWRQMDLVANPGGRALARVVGVGIVGRTDEE